MKQYSKILKRGEYEAVLSRVEDKISKKGNPMWVAHWIVIESPESAITIVDYVVKSLAWKVGRIANALNRLTEFEAGRFDLTEHLESHITVRLEIETQMGYEQRNKIEGYLPLKRELRPT